VYTMLYCIYIVYTFIGETMEKTVTTVRLSDNTKKQLAILKALEGKSTDAILAELLAQRLEQLGASIVLDKK
jgi:hypothetical protein